MGAYLSSPVTEKDWEDGEYGRLRYGIAAMQGWRRNMEDAHLAEAEVEGDERTAMFGVFDGHGGREVAHFVARHFIEEVVEQREWKDGAYEDALRQSFHRMDELLRREEFDSELKLYKVCAPTAAASGKASSLTPQGSVPPKGSDQGETPRSTSPVADSEGGIGGARDESKGRLPDPGVVLKLEGLSLGDGQEGGAGERGGRKTQDSDQAGAGVGGKEEGVNVEKGEGEKERKEVLGAGGGQGVAALTRTATSVSDGAIPEEDVVLGRRGGLEKEDGSGLALRPVEDPNLREEAEGLPRSPLPFEEAATELLKAQGISPPFPGGKTGDEDEEGGAGGGGGRAASEVAEMAGVIVTELLSRVKGEEAGSDGSGGAREEGERGKGASGGEEGEESETEGSLGTDASSDAVVSSSYPPPASTFRTAGSRARCALPDHRVQAGCTSVVALIVEKELFVANAGDSRAVLCRGGRAIALTEDHKPFQDREMERIRKAGGFVTEQGRVNGNLNLSRSIGDLKYKGEKTTREDEESRAGNFPFPLLFSSTSMTTQLFVSRFQARPCSWEAWH